MFFICCSRGAWPHCRVSSGAAAFCREHLRSRSPGCSAGSEGRGLSTSQNCSDYKRKVTNQQDKFESENVTQENNMHDQKG